MAHTNTSFVCTQGSLHNLLLAPLTIDTITLIITLATKSLHNTIFKCGEQQQPTLNSHPTTDSAVHTKSTFSNQPSAQLQTPVRLGLSMP